MSDTEGWTPTDEDVEAGARAACLNHCDHTWAEAPWGAHVTDVRAVLAAMAPRVAEVVARERRAAKVEALRDAAEAFWLPVTASAPYDPSYLLNRRADAIERGALKSCDCGVEFNHDHGSSTRNVMATPADAESVLDALPALLRADGPAGDALRARLGLFPLVNSKTGRAPFWVINMDDRP